jgi:ATP-dependent RNA helicase RhlE
MTFSKTGLDTPLLQALSDKGYETPTPIQVQAIPPILNGKDILGCAQTGTGKTAAFSVPIIQNLYRSIGRNSGNRRAIGALILTPTRELAIQIEENIKAYNKYTKLSHAVIYGGVKQGSQVDQLKRGIDILVATPGRLLDLIGQGYVDLSEIKVFVLDEADRMLDMGFINDIKKVLKLIPAKRQSLFFSATMPDNIVALSKQILTNPQKIEVSPASTTAETVHLEVLYTNRNLKSQLLLHTLNERKIDHVLVFTRTKHGADRVARFLKKNNISSSSIHGDKAQNQRQKALKLFKEGKLNVLVATDIAARGIDIDKLKFVINYEIPHEPEAYVHRIGRSGRAGEEGVAISFAEPEENAYIRDIEKLIGQKINVVKDHPYPQTDKPMNEEEKKEWRKEKERRKQEFFSNRRKNKGTQNKSRPSSAKEENKSRRKPNPKRRSTAKPEQTEEIRKSDSSDKRDAPKQNSSRNSSRNKNRTKGYQDRLRWPLE